MNNKLYKNICGIRNTWVFATPDHTEKVMLKYSYPDTILVHLGKWYTHADDDAYFDWDYTGSIRFRAEELDINNLDIQRAYEFIKKHKPEILELDESTCDDCHETIVNKEDGMNICSACMMENIP